MIQAILEITGMLLGALAIGIFFTYRYWKSKFQIIEQSNLELQMMKEELDAKSIELTDELSSQQMEHKTEINKLKDQERATVTEMEKAHEKELKKLKSDLRSSNKEQREEKKKHKEVANIVASLKKELELKDEQLGEKERELEDVTKHFDSHNISYYKQIEGKRYKAATLQEATVSVEGQGDGRISKSDAEKIFATISDGHVYTQVEKDTMHYIREHYNWTPEADELFRKKVRSWAAKGHQF